MKDFSIVIPTYNRPAYLHRILSYYDSFRENFRIIVADSSLDENKEINKNVISSVTNLDIQYLDSYPTEIHQLDKFSDAVNHVEEKYCVFCADDDFITPNGINQSVDFLEKNSDFTVAQGYYVTFNVRSDRKKESQFWWTPIDADQSITFPNPQDRLCYHLSNYVQTTFYGVHRTDFLKMIFTEAPRFTDDLRFGELLLTMLTLIYGKLKCLDLIFAARDATTIYMHTSPKYRETLAGFVKEGTYNDKYAKFRACLSTHLSQQSQLDIEESKKIVDDAMSAYMEKYSTPISKVSLRSIMAPLTTKTGLFLDRLNLPNWLDNGIRKTYKMATGSSDTNENAIDESIPSSYLEDINRIRHHILSSS